MTQIITIIVEESGVRFVTSDGLTDGNALQMLALVEHELHRRLARAELEAETMPEENENNAQPSG